MASATASGSGSTSIVGAAEIQHLRTRIPMMTVVEMKGFMRDLLARCSVRLAVSGTKQALINRIEEQLVSWQQANKIDFLRIAMRLANAPRDIKGGLLDTGEGASSSNGVATWPPVNNHVGYPLPPAYAAVPPGKLSNPNGNRAAGYGHATGSGSVRQPALPKNIRFKSSPFFKLEMMLTDTVLLIEADTTRRTVSIDLRLTPQQTALLRGDSSVYQARLFCAQKASAEVSERNPGMPAFIDFPGSCELRINSNVYTSSLKGSRSKPGRVPPPNLNKDRTLITRDGVNNKIELVYTNAPYKYVMVIGLCRYTPPEAIVARIKSERSRSREEIVGTMKRAAAEDDIEMGTATLSLKDPLSYTRITEPCRSIHCSHSQCFDALFFFLSNEQSPTWSCPHCSRILKPEELFIDGYFAHILRTVSEDEDAVIVEADGSWKTRDGKYASSAAAIPTGASISLATPATNGHTSKQATEPPPVVKRSSSVALPAESVVPPGAEVVLLDDTPSPAASPPLPVAIPASSPIQSNATAPRPASAVPHSSNVPVAGGIIDLTESDDEDVPLSRTASAPEVHSPRLLHSVAGAQPSSLSVSGQDSNRASGSGTGSGYSQHSPMMAAPSQPFQTWHTARTSLPPSSSTQHQMGSSTSAVDSSRNAVNGHNPTVVRQQIARVSTSNGPLPQSPHTSRSSPSVWGTAQHQPRIISATGGMREVRPAPTQWRPPPSLSYPSPALHPSSTSTVAPLVRKQSGTEGREKELPIYPPLLSTRSASVTETASLSTARDNVYWPSSYRPQQVQQTTPIFPLPPASGSSSSSRIRAREGSSEAIGDGHLAGAKRQRQDDTARTSSDQTDVVAAFTTRSGRPSAAAGSLREDSTPLPSVTPSPPPTDSGHTSTRARDSHTHSVEHEDEEYFQEGEEEEEDAPPTRPGRTVGVGPGGGGSGGGVRGPSINNNASAAATLTDSPPYVSAPENLHTSSSTARSDMQGHDGATATNGLSNDNGDLGNGEDSSSSIRRADSFDDYDGLMDDYDDSGEWQG